MNDLCPPSGKPELLVVFTSTRVRDRVPRVPESRPKVLKLIDFGQAAIGMAAAAFISRLRGNTPADALTRIPCGSFATVRPIEEGSQVHRGREAARTRGLLSWCNAGRQVAKG
jgi:hypothetical protein